MQKNEGATLEVDAMSFSEQYATLEVKFKAQVEKDNRDFKPHGFESNFLANIAPEARWITYW